MIGRKRAMTLWRPALCLSIVLASAVMGPVRTSAQVSTELQSANDAAKAFCDPAIIAFDADLDNVAPGVDSFEKMLAAAEAEQNKKATPEPANPSTPAPATAVMAQGKMILAVARDQVSVAKAYRVEAAAVLSRAAAEPNPTLAAVHYKDAIDKMGKAQGLLGKAATTLSLPAQPAEAMARRFDLRDDWAALRELRKIAQDTSRPGNQLGALLQDWDGAAARAIAVVAPPADGSFGIRRYDEGTKTLSMANGQRIDLRPLDRALAATPVRGPLFHPIAGPIGGAVLQPSPGLMRALGNRDLRGAVDAVGGVALDVTFALLSQAGLPDLGSGRPLAYIERPVMLSLATLYERVKSHARSEREWRSLPDDLRHPGGLGRIHGYVLDPARKDVFVIGAAAAQARDRIDIDALSILLATAWRNGQVPAVSLDPVPSDPAGPQYPRIVNQPPDSIVAKTMLDADYEMKRLTFGLRRVAGTAFTAYPDLVKSMADTDARASRFWFHPVPLREHTIKVSGSGRSLLFSSGVQLLTESMTIENGAFVPSGEVGRVERQVADSFTANFAALAENREVQPAGIFLRLHGLVDVATLAVLLRRAGIDYPVLDQISRLPHRRLIDKDSLPVWYPGLTTTIALTDNARDYVVSGGVEIQARATRDAVERRDDPSIGALERAADSSRPGRDLVIAAPMPLTLTSAAPDGDRERRMVAAFRALALGDHARASEAFAEVTKRDPLNSEAWAHLASAYANLGRHAEARTAIARALALDPGDSQVKALALDVSLKADPAADPLAMGSDTLRVLSQDYVARALGAVAAGQQERAMVLANRALALDEDNADAHLARAWARGGVEPEAERRDIVEALRLMRRQARDPSGAAPSRLAFLLAVSAVQRIQRASRYGAKDGAAEQEINFMVAEMQRAAEEAQEARKLDPAQPLAFAAEVQARALRIALLKAAGQTATTKPVLQLLDDGLKRFANFPSMHTARAAVAFADGRPAEAVAALGEAIRLAPAAGEIYVLRATTQADLGRCAEARADLARAESLRAVVVAAERNAVAGCR